MKRFFGWRGDLFVLLPMLWEETHLSVGRVLERCVLLFLSPLGKEKSAEYLMLNVHWHEADWNMSDAKEGKTTIYKPTFTLVEANTNDIHIGETERIRWVEFNISSNELTDVDYVVAKHNDFWTSLEVFCVSGCCGLNAFSFYREEIGNASNGVDHEILIRDLMQLKQDLQASAKEVVTSSRLNNLIDKTVFIQLLDHIISTLNSKRET